LDLGLKKRQIPRLFEPFRKSGDLQDFGGPVLAAQWRAAVKEVQKPFVMPE